ncbi:MAG: hemerythrin family protein [Spirochaetes bacterium]|nr:hemerythrin family protein [Spirochaetota bacterium]
MPAFDDIWTDKMYTGIDHIDDHHKKLVHLLIDIYNVVEANGSPVRIREILAELVSYTKYHFAAEERLMMEIKYPRLQEQRLAHEWFTDKLNEHFLAVSTKNEELPLQLLKFLRDWYANHILKFDLDIGLFMKDPGRYGNS